MQAFDHFAISAATLDAGRTYVERRLGAVLLPGGRHDLMGTHNLLAGLGAGEYLEVIAIDPDAAPPHRPRWFDLDRREGPPRLSNWILRTDDIAALVARHPDAGTPVALSRGAFRWRMAIPDDGILPFDGCFPAIIQWDSAAPDFAGSDRRLTRLALSHPGGARLAAVLAEILDDPRIEVTTGAPSLAAHIYTPDGPRVLE